MKLFVDDLRDIPTGYTCVRTYDRAVILLDMLEFEVISLDYDLGSKETGLDIIKYINKTKKYPKHLNIHSTHPTGSREMYLKAKNTFSKDVIITRNSL